GDQVLQAGRLVVGSRHGPAILDAVDADHVLLVGQLLAVLDEEAGLADELVGLLGLDAAGAVAPVVGLGRLVLVLVLVVLRRDAVLEDLVEVGLDVVGVELLLVVVLLLVLGGLAGLAGRRGRDLVLLLLLVLVDDLVEDLVVGVEVVGLVEHLVVDEGVVLEDLVGGLVVSHRVPSRGSAMGGRDHRHAPTGRRHPAARVRRGPTARRAGHPGCAGGQGSDPMTAT